MFQKATKHARSWVADPAAPSAWLVRWTRFDWQTGRLVGSHQKITAVVVCLDPEDGVGRIRGAKYQCSTSAVGNVPLLKAVEFPKMKLTGSRTAHRAVEGVNGSVRNQHRSGHGQQVQRGGRVGHRTTGIRHESGDNCQATSLWCQCISVVGGIRKIGPSSSAMPPSLSARHS